MYLNGNLWEYEILQVLLIASTIINFAFVYAAIKGWYKEKQMQKLWEDFEPDPTTLTCYNCAQREMCALVDDPYNTNGDCLAYK